MADCITSNGVASMMANRNPDSNAASSVNIVVQVLELKRIGSSARFTTMVSDGSQKLRAALPSSLNSLAEAGQLQERGTLRILDYTFSNVAGKDVLMITKGEVVGPALEFEHGIKREMDVKPTIRLEVKPTFQVESKAGKGNHNFRSAAQIVQEQRGNAAPASMMGISRRVYPIVSLNPYQGNWTIKVRVTSKGPLRSFKNARGAGNVFNVELTDEDGTQILATMFKEAADKFFDKLQLGKVYFISKGSLRVANKQFSNVNNDYEMTLNANSEVEEVPEDAASIQMPAMKYKFVKIDALGPYVNGRELVDVLGIVQSVGSIVMIRRKNSNEEIPKRDITIADESQKTVVVSLWNNMAMNEGATLSNTVNDSPVLMVKSLRASDFQGVSLSTTSNSMVAINPDIPEAIALRNWHSESGGAVSLTPAGASLPGGVVRVMGQSSNASRAVLSEATLPSVGEDKPAYFNVRAVISFIKPDQAMWYLACVNCNRKVTEESSTSYWCEGCQKHSEKCNRRYILLAKLSDATGEAWISAFNEQAEQILGRSAEDLSLLRSQVGEGKEYEAALCKAQWAPLVFLISVAQTEYMNEKRQRITVRSVGSVDWAAECKLLLESIAKLK